MPDKELMIESPKKRFLKTAHANKAAEFIADPAIMAALDAALLQMTWEHGVAQTEGTASGRHYQLTGAHKFRSLFLSIGIPEKPMPKPKGDSLQYQV